MKQLAFLVRSVLSVVLALLAIAISATPLVLLLSPQLLETSSRALAIPPMPLLLFIWLLAPPLMMGPLVLLLGVNKELKFLG